MQTTGLTSLRLETYEVKLRNLSHVARHNSAPTELLLVVGEHTKPKLGLGDRIGDVPEVRR
jgi:hypothetical protein